MTDLASLILKVDSTEVKKGTAELDRLAAAGVRVEGQTVRLKATNGLAAKSIQQFAQGMEAFNRRQNSASQQAAKMIAATTGIGKASGLARHHLQNLTFQVNDLAMGLATGQDPMRVFIQQGSQIAQIGQQAGIGLGGMLKAVLRMAAPYAAVAAAAGLAAIAFGRVKDEANDAGLDAYIRSLGLTKDEIEDLKDTTVTWGDITQATFDVLAERAGTSSSEIKGAFADAFESIGEFGKFSVGVLLGAFGALVKGVISAAGNIALGLAKGIGAGINKVAEMIEGLINGAVAAINTFSGFLKSMGVNVGSVGNVKLGRVEVGGSFSNPFADMKDQFFQTYNDVQSGFSAIGARADQYRKDRIGSQARDMIEDRPDKKGGAGSHKKKAQGLSDEEKAYRKALDAAQDYLSGLQKETDALGQNEVVQKRMEAATAAAAARQAAAIAPTKEGAAALNLLADSIMAAEQAWEAVNKSNAAAEFIKNTVEPLEFENTLLGLNAKAQALARAERELTLAQIERGSEAWNRYLDAVGKAADAEAKKHKSPFEEWGETVPHTAQQINDAFEGIAVRGIDSMADALTGVIMGTESLGEAFSNIARQIIADIIQMTIRMLIFKAISSAFPGLFGGGGAPVPSAKGNVFSGGNIVPFAYGGVVGGPTLFPMAGGRTGLMGEAGPEAIMPLARDGQGRLGVRAGNREPIHIQLDLNNEMLEGKIIRTSNAVVEFKRKGIVDQASAQTLHNAGRKKLMGR